MAVLAAVPGFKPGTDPEAPLRDVLRGEGVVPASLRGIEQLIRSTVDRASDVWDRYAQDEVVEVAAGRDDPELLVRLGHASHLRTVVDLSASSLKPSWRWPLRLGFLPESEALEKRARAALQWLGLNVDFVLLGQDAANCDVAVAATPRAAEAFERTVGVTAALLLVLGRGDEVTASMVERAAAGADAVDASGFSVVVGDTRRQLDFLGEMIAQLSHAEALPLAIHRAAKVNDQQALLSASPGLVEASNLRHYLPELHRRAQRVHRDVKVRVDDSVYEILRRPRGSWMSLERYTGGLADSADDLIFDSEDRVGRALAKVSREVERAESTPRGPRFLQGQLFLKATPPERTPVFVAGARHMFRVRVGSASVDWSSVKRSFPEAGLFPRGVKYVDLDVALVIPALDARPVATGTIRLPRTGDSSPADLQFDVPEEAIEVRATVILSRGSTGLQVGELHGPVVPAKPTGRVAAKRRFVFELKTVTSDGSLERVPAAGSGTATIVVGDTVAVISGNPGAVHIDAALGKEFAKVGGNVAQDLRDAAGPFKAAAVTSAGSPWAVTSGIAALRSVAQAGSDLLSSLVGHIDLAPLQAAGTLRLVLTDDSLVLPLELGYDGPVGDRAKPCAQSLADCRCTGGAKRSVICLSRFWGLTKLIERHASTDLAAGSGQTVSDPKSPTSKLAPLTSALLGVTTKVPDDKRAETRSGLAQRVSQVEDVASWAAWRKKARRRTLLIGVVHNEPLGSALSALEIGDGKLLRLGQLDEEIVGRSRRGSGPMVVLIGCRTAAPDNPLLSFVSRFRMRGASVVVGTVADIPADHAGELVLAVLDSLRAQLHSAESVSLAVAMRAARGNLLASGSILGMALVSYGDADWQLTGRGT